MVLYAAAEEPLLNSCTVTGSVVEPKLFAVPLSVPTVFPVPWRV